MSLLSYVLVLGGIGSMSESEFLVSVCVSLFFGFFLKFGWCVCVFVCFSSSSFVLSSFYVV